MKKLKTALTCMALLAACGESGDGGMMPPGEMPMECSAAAPHGVCPPGHRCDAGVCVEIPLCGRDGNEPNDSRETATLLDETTVLDGNSCDGDVDWFRIEVPPGLLANVVATVPWPTNQTADLDAFASTNDGLSLGGRLATEEPTPSGIKRFETDEEGFGFHASTEAKTFFVKVVPATPSAAGTYVIQMDTTEWKDGGFECEDIGYTRDECTGGKKGEQKLWMFPFAEADDSFVPDGYLFQSVSNYKWLRRETIMLLRYAIAEVQKQFPGTRALGFADMSQRDGITPGYDIGGPPRHPGNSHAEGGNLDIAYYQTGADNHIRSVCNGKKGNITADGHYCLPGATSTHVVDLRRSVYLIVAMARSSRFRAAGLDKVIGPLMAGEAQRMLDEGLIDKVEHEAYRTHVTWGDGWPAHHDHIHVSLQYLP